MEVIDPAMTVKCTGLFFNESTNINQICISSSLNLLKSCGLLLYKLHKEKYKTKIFLNNQNINICSFHTVVKARNRIGPHDKDIISVLIGSLLGDGYANKRYVEGTRFCFRQSIIHKDYLF